MELAAERLSESDDDAVATRRLRLTVVVVLRRWVDHCWSVRALRTDAASFEDVAMGVMLTSCGVVLGGGNEGDFVCFDAFNRAAIKFALETLKSALIEENPVKSSHLNNYQE